MSGFIAVGTYFLYQGGSGGSALLTKSVLVIEADHETRVAVRRVLEGAGYFVVSSTNGQDALSMLDKITPPGLVLLSSKLPFMSGAEFLAKFRSDPRFRSVPVGQFLSEGDAALDGMC